MMRRFLQWMSVILALFCAVPALAQEPQVTVEFEREPVLVGQPFVVRVKVLVPSFMPHPPVWPTFEAAGLMVRFPSRATSPVSERIGGETWSGIQRTYRIYPTRLGTIAIPPQKIAITYKDYETNQDKKLVKDIPEVFVVGTVPDGARDMDPLILAQQVSITQEWEAPEGNLKVGDAIVRRLDASIEGASPLFIPPLLDEPEDEAEAPVADTPEPVDPDAPEVTVAQLGVYPQDPSVSETLDRGIMSGTRQDQVTYLPQTGGVATLPDITLSWYNLDSDKLETITLPGRSFTVDAPPAGKPKLDRDTVLKIIAGLLVAIAVVWLFRRYVAPRIKAHFEKRKAAFLASAVHAHHEALEAARAKDLGALFNALDHLAGIQGHRDDAVDHALKELTHAAYYKGADKVMVRHFWDNMVQALKRARPPLRPQEDQAEPALPGMNPFSATSQVAKDA